MINFLDLAIASFIALISTFFLTFLVKKIAFKLKIVDFPNQRKIHIHPTPRIGGVAIFLGAALGLIYLRPEHIHLNAIIIGSLVIIITGVLDDKFNIRPILKLTGQLVAASFLISSGLVIEKITLPFIGMIDLGMFSVLITILWVVGITNAINLIDGLDGLATGVSTIGLISILIMAITDLQIFAVYLCVVLIGANLGFLYHNFYPAKIYMGDTGSNFLGYMIAVISMLGLFKNVALFSFIIPIIVIALPILDTLFSIIRRMMNKQKIMEADNKHIHYQLLRAGFTHRQSVLVMYGFSLIFGVLAIVFAKAPLQLSFLVAFIVFILVHVLAEVAGIVRGGERPLVNRLLRIVGKDEEEQIEDIKQKVQDESEHKKREH